SAGGWVALPSRNRRAAAIKALSRRGPISKKAFPALSAQPLPYTKVCARQERNARVSRSIQAVRKRWTTAFGDSTRTIGRVGFFEHPSSASAMPVRKPALIRCGEGRIRRIAHGTWGRFRIGARLYPGAAVIRYR